MDHQGVIPVAKSTFIQERSDLILNSYIAHIALKKDIDIYNTTSSDFVKRMMVLYVFQTNICDGLRFDFTKYCLRRNSNILSDYELIKHYKYPIIILCVNCIGLVYQGVLYKSDDIFILLALWIVIISKKKFEIDTIDKIHNLDSLKTLLLLEKHKIIK